MCTPVCVDLSLPLLFLSLSGMCVWVCVCVIIKGSVKEEEEIIKLRCRTKMGRGYKHVTYNQKSGYCGSQGSLQLGMETGEAVGEEGKYN